MSKKKKKYSAYKIKKIMQKCYDKSMDMPSFQKNILHALGLKSALDKK